MSIRVDAYIQGGVASGVVARTGHLRDLLEADGQLTLERVRWRSLEQAHAPTGQAVDDLTIPIDDLFVAVGDDAAPPPTHATWHAVRVEIGPYVVAGEMPTLPGFDPDKALARPTGEFVMLRDVRLGARTADGAATLQPIGDHALVNRYDVERVAADLMLGFFFPGAELEDEGSAAPA